MYLFFIVSIFYGFEQFLKNSRFPSGLFIKSKDKNLIAYERETRSHEASRAIARRNAGKLSKNVEFEFWKFLPRSTEIIDYYRPGAVIS